MGYKRNTRIFVNIWLIVLTGLVVIACDTGSSDDINKNDPAHTLTVDVTVPDNNSLDVPTDRILLATFNNDLDPATVSTESAFINAGIIESVVTCSEHSIIIDPVNTLDLDSRYSVTITADVADIKGNRLSSDYTWSFRTKSGPDVTPPIVESIASINGSTDFSADDNIYITFNEAIHPLSATESTVYINNGDIISDVSCSGNIITIDPVARLDYSTEYSVTVTTFVQDLAGNQLEQPYFYSFRTGPNPDIYPPEVVDIFPASGDEENVSINSNIIIEFDGDLDTGTVSSSSVMINGGLIAADIRCTGDTITIDPAENFDYNTEYTVTLTTDITDLAGNNLADNYSWTFNTIEASDITAPVIDETNPEPGETGISIEPEIIITFNENLDESTVNFTTFFINDRAIPATVNCVDNIVTITPVNELSHDTSYTVTVTTGVQDLAGNSFETEFEFTFTTEEPPDTINPFIEMVTPIPGTPDAEADTIIVVTFNEAINDASVNEETVMINGGEIPADYSCVNNIVTITPQSYLEYETDYTVTITTGVQDLSLNNMSVQYEWSFSTGEEPDLDPPYVVDSNPPSGQTGVPVNTNIIVYFSEDLDESTVNGTTVLLNNGDVSAVVTCDENRININPEEYLDFTTEYTVQIGAGVQDLSGNSIESEYSLIFTTGYESDTTPPEIVEIDPPDGSFDVKIDSNIIITFSEYIDPETVNSSTILLDEGELNAEITCNENIVTIDPEDDFAYNAPYSITVTTGVQDTAGNSLEAEFESTFTTDAKANYFPPAVIATSPGSYDFNVPINSNITITFSEDIDPDTVSADTVMINAGEIPASIDCSGSTITITPDENFYFDTEYTVTISSDIQDMVGNAMGNAYNLIFSTIHDGDTNGLTGFYDFTIQNEPEETARVLQTVKLESLGNDITIYNMWDQVIGYATYDGTTGSFDSGLNGSDLEMAYNSTERTFSDGLYSLVYLANSPYNYIQDYEDLSIDDIVFDSTGGSATEIEMVYIGIEGLNMILDIVLIEEAQFPHSGNENDTFEFRIKYDSSDENISIIITDRDTVEVINGYTGESFFTTCVETEFEEDIIVELPLTYLEGFDKMEITASSNYWFSEEDYGSYDRILFYVNK